ncbi:MAG: nucleotide exchange factor GrpE [Limisphaerales bacterium]
MTNAESSLPVWPFLVADAFFLVAASLIFFRGHQPLLWWEALFLVTCAVAAAGSMMAPYLRRNRDEQSMAQMRLLADATSQLQQLEQLAASISGATSQWREFHEQTALAAANAKAVAGSMSVEMKAFTEFLQKSNDAEKAHLRLEVEKMRRSEQEWLQVMVFMLDHTFALSQAARRSGQPGLIEQLSHFQNSCRDAARRLGLVPTLAAPGEAFDPKAHQLEGASAPPENALIAETLMTGYTYQGQPLRRALVAVRGPESPQITGEVESQD